MTSKPESSPPPGEGHRYPEPEEEEVPAGLWGKLLLTSAPFVAILLLFLLDRCILGR